MLIVEVSHLDCINDKQECIFLVDFVLSSTNITIVLVFQITDFFYLFPLSSLSKFILPCELI